MRSNNGNFYTDDRLGREVQTLRHAGGGVLSASWARAISTAPQCVGSMSSSHHSASPQPKGRVDGSG